MGCLAEDLLIKTNESLMYNELNLNDSILKLNTQQSDVDLAILGDTFGKEERKSEINV